MFEQMIDLHVHTTASDGIYSPEEIVRRACDEGLSLIAVTDHDSMDGVEAAEKAAIQTNGLLRVIGGCELSIEFDGGDFHLLGYNLKASDEMSAVLSGIKKCRAERIYNMIEDIANSGVDISISDLDGFNESSSPGKPLIARALIKKGYVSDIKDAFTKFMCSGKPGFVPKKKILPEDGFRMIRESGGFSSLAHPSSLNIDDDLFELYLQKLIKLGLNGIEAYSAIATEKQTELYLKLASKYDLIVTGGSDYHGDHRENLGYYKPGRAVPDDLALRFYELCKD
ncbi:MAG TPA: PHP domain-containing protein [Spirochaetota bacterium]|nr:PHP domain-containing protein [Spirochaetota bacterium]